MLNKHIKRIHDSHIEKANKILTLQKGYDWFMKHFGYLIFNHEDLRGGNETPVIILATDSPVEIRYDLKREFESDENYPMFKKYLLSIGTVNSRGKTYFYIQCNCDLSGEYSDSEIKETMLNRCNREVFEHIDNYFK